MSHERDISLIKSTIYSYLEDNFSGTIRWQDTPTPEVDSWAEVWAKVSLEVSRKAEYYYRISLVVNVFGILGGNLFTLDNLSGELCSLLKGATIQVSDDGEKRGIVNFLSPESVDLGPISTGVAGRLGITGETKYRQHSVSCDGVVFPVST